VDDPLAAVDLDDLALATLVGATNDQNLVILADGDGANLHFRKIAIGPLLDDSYPP
jgi:hypothetical protein